ncbi:MAG: hypothetical protein ACRD9R_23445, partial [Pyrinomonadaceae bacterium]
LRTGIKYGLLVLAALVLVLFVLRPARRALKAAAAASEPLLLTAGAHTSGSLPALAAAGAGGGAVALTAAQTDAISFGSESGADAPRTVAELEAAMDAEVAREFEMAVPQVNRAGAIKKAIVEQTLKNPDMVAMTVRGWLQDSK